MNLYGSYRKLLDNSKHAIMAAIEIYNKPKFEYREEVFSILISNAWELLLLAILSKNRVRIFRKKERHKDYQTLHFEDSIREAKKHFPNDMPSKPIIANIQLLRTFRNISVHYYHEPVNKQTIYFLAQAAIKNYRDVVLSIFKQDISNEVTIVLLPLSFNRLPDFVEFLKPKKETNYTPFEETLFASLKDLEKSNGADIDRFVTFYTIKFERTSDTNSADIIAGKSANEDGRVIVKDSDPDQTHPFVQSDIIGSRKKSKHRNLNRDINSYSFQAVIWHHNIKNAIKYCWASTRVGVPRYSSIFVDFLNNLTDDDVKIAREKYKAYQSQKRASKKARKQEKERQ